MTALNGKLCIVTGGGSGIGRAIVLEMADMGAKVAVAGRTLGKLDAVVDETSSAPGEARAYTMDVSDFVAVNAVVTDVVNRWGRVDVLVNNAGANVPHRGTIDTTHVEIEQLIAINLTGTIFCTKAVLPAMLERGVGTIVNVSSNAALWPGMMSGVAYAAAKAGVNNFTEFPGRRATAHRNTGLCYQSGRSRDTDTGVSEHAARRFRTPNDVPTGRYRCGRHLCMHPASQGDGDRDGHKPDDFARDVLS